MKKVAKFWKPLNDKKVQCNLCSHHCKIDDGKVGICTVRKNEEGKLFTLIYGSCSSVAADPIEKKPLYHFHPGTTALSLGTVGCNFKCDHCQNASISTATPVHSNIREIMPEQAIRLAQEYNCQGISWTYNEPTIWHEYCFDSAKIAKKAGFYTSYVSNGYISEDPLKELSQFLDAMNIDVKAFNEDFYKKVCKARLEPVLQTCERANEFGIHLEVTYLVIPGYNDSNIEVEKFCKWVVEKLGNETPVHFSRFRPDHRMTDVSRTPMEKMLKLHNVAKANGVLYPYMGNVPAGDYEHTRCPKCGHVCIKRNGYSINKIGIRNGKCVKCNYFMPIVIN